MSENTKFWKLILNILRIAAVTFVVIAFCPEKGFLFSQLLSSLSNFRKEKEQVKCIFIYIQRNINEYKGRGLNIA